MGPTMSAHATPRGQTPDRGAVAAACVALALAGGGFEPTAFAAAGLVVWVAVVVGLAVGVVPRSEPAARGDVAGLALAGLAAITALSLAWASDDGSGFEDAVRTLAYLGGFVLVVVASRRGEARPWLRRPRRRAGGRRGGRAAWRASSPRCSATPTPTSPRPCPRRSAGSPIRSATGTGSPRRWPRRSCCSSWFAATAALAGRAARRRSRRCRR